MSVITTGPTVRIATPSDDPVRRAIYRSVRSPELAAIGWPDSVIENFCDQQYAVRQQSYAMSVPAAEHAVLAISDDLSMPSSDTASSDTVVGELIVDHGPTSTTIVNIALLPTYRGQGIGTSVLAGVIAAAEQRGVGVELTVDRGNPARSLYQRLGFVITESSELHDRMRRPATSATTRKDTA